LRGVPPQVQFGMRKCWLVLAVTLYLSLDVADPLMPGALTFGSETSLELRQAERFRGHHGVVASPQSFDRVDGLDDQAFTKARRPVEEIAAASPPMRRARSSLFSASAPSDDPPIARS
jgi:hypothetical protein